MDLINNAEVTEEGNSELDYTFNKLVADTMNEPNGGFKHPAYLAYHKSMGGEKDNVRTIILSAQVRLATLDNPEVRRILSDDELDLASIGTGQTIKGEKNVKTALFCVIPDSDTTYNCIAGMIYTLLFQELYFQADFKFGGKLPVPVTFWMDEFANIALPNDFPKLLSTMRSRAISCVIIVQNLSQLKELYKDYWERIPSDCDVFIYLGGNEQASFKYLSENMGDKTIRKKSTGESKGRNGSTSVNTDGLGRKLMLPEEVRELDNDYCIVFVRGQKPILDHKFRTLEAADFKRSKELGPYIHSQCKKLDNDIKIQLYDKKLHNVPPNGIEIDLEQYTSYITDDELARIIAENDEEGFDNEKEIDITDMSIEEILSLPELSLSDDELVEVTTGIYNGLTDEEIKSYILFGDAKRMKSQRLLLEALRARSMVSQG
jgi:type IV secretion system protein VirD4